MAVARRTFGSFLPNITGFAGMLSGALAPCASTGVAAVANVPNASAAVPIERMAALRLIFSLDIMVG